MARIIVLGAGIAGHTAALILRRRVSREHEVVVVSPNRLWNWIPYDYLINATGPRLNFAARPRRHPDFPCPATHEASLAEMGVGCVASAGHWIKRILHHMFLYKAKALPGWWLIPE